MNYFNETEKNLKKVLKMKVSITTATIVTFLLTGTISLASNLIGELVTEDKVVNENVEIKATNDDHIYGIVSQEGKKAEYLGKDINIDVTSTNGDGTGVIALVVDDAKGNNEIILGGEETENINIKVKSNGWATGLDSRRKYGEFSGGTSYIETNSKNLNIDVYSDESYAYGVLVQNSSTSDDNVKEKSKVVINSENTIINVGAKNENYATGLVVISEGNLEINGNLEVNATTVLATRGEAVTVINKNGENTVKLNGNIEFDYNHSTSQTTIDADVTINLSNSDSYLNGNIQTSSDIDPIPDGKDNVDGMKLGISNGAQWNTDDNSFVNILTFNEGIININGGNDHTVQIDKIEGTGGDINIKTTKTENGFDAGNLVVREKENTSRPKLDVNFVGITADDISTEDFQELAEGHITGEGLATLDTTVKVEEGLLDGTITGELEANGKLDVSSIKQKESNTVAGLKNIAAINFLTWRQEMGSLNQRMGELRDSQGTSGVWARVYGGEFELGNRFENEYQTYQVGYDKNYDYAGGKLFLGYLFSYTDGSTDYDLGSGDNNSFGAGVYGTWLNNTGHYIDVIAKVNRLHNEYDVYSSTGVQSKGDYTNYGVSLSAEYGKRFTVDRIFVEPSIRIDLGKVGHRSYTTSSGVRVDQDSIYTTQGSLGAKLGYRLAKGNIYARLSGVKEFAGDIDMHYRSGELTKTDSLDLEDEWIEFGIGGNYRVRENVNLYLDLSRTTDATVDTNWQANLGFRYEF